MRRQLFFIEKQLRKAIKAYFFDKIKTEIYVIIAKIFRPQGISDYTVCVSPVQYGLNIQININMKGIMVKLTINSVLSNEI